MLVESQPDMAMAWEAGDGAQAAVSAVERCPDVMLMDLRMPVLDGVGATRRIVREAEAAGTGAPKIIALTTFNRDQAVVDAVHAGASGYLLKSAEPEFLLAAIRTVYAGYSVIAPGSVQDLFQHAARTVPAGGRICPCWKCSLPGNGTCSCSRPRGWPTVRSPEACSFRRRPSRHTSGACWASWASGPGSSWWPSHMSAGCWAETQG